MEVEGKVNVALILGYPPLSRTYYVVFLVVKLPLKFQCHLGKVYVVQL